jgi:hypothetical protein
MTTDSSISILRWQAGSGGDTLLSMIIGSNPNLCSNVVWDCTTVEGGTRVTGNIDHENFINLPHLVDIAINSRYNNVSIDQFKNSITKLKLLSKNFMLKSHWYKSSLFNDITIDLVPSTEMLPFVVGALFEKNSEYITNYNLIRAKIKEPAVRKLYDWYNISWDRLYNGVEYSKNQIPVEVLLGGWDMIRDCLGSFDLHLDDCYQAYYTAWLEKNQQYLPSGRYKELVKNCNFDYKDNQLTMIERYCLLAMSREKFTILH